MSRFYSYLNSAEKLLSDYKGKEPFSLFLKAFFKQYKKYGSRDRREISNLCYCYFRLGKSLPDLEIQERILVGLFLCSQKPNPVLSFLKPAWSEQIEETLAEKLNFLGYSDLLKTMFPFKDDLSKEIEYQSYIEAFLVQPDLFLRVRPNKEKLVTSKLRKDEIEFEQISDSVLAIPNSRKVDQIIELDKEAVVQDLNSQKVGDVFKNILGTKPISVWDCCAASGGKSIMAYDLNPRIKITVSDIRESMLINLKKRFNKAGIRSQTSFISDLSQPKEYVSNAPFDVIIADVPCTGSGTWSRTPEQLFYFEKAKIQEYASVQRTIIKNAIPHLKSAGFLVYITCSVFEKENEENIEFFKNEFELKELKREVLKGYNQKADSMFVSVLKRSE